MTTVPSGYTGVEVRLDKVTGATYMDGFHFTTPFITKVVKMTNQVQKDMKKVFLAKSIINYI